MRFKTAQFLLLAGLLGACTPGYAPSSSGGSDSALGQDGGADALDVADSHDSGADAADSGPMEGDAYEDAGDQDSGEQDAAEQDTGDDTDSSSCVPNHDGRIERGELTLRPGLHATFRVAENVAVDTHGAEQADGSRLWDLSATLDGDESVLVELQSLDGKWFAPEFPEADYASKLTAGDDTLGVFGTDSDGLYLHGVVSKDDGLYATELTYDPPASVLEFPLEQGRTWASDSNVSGRYLGNPWTAADEQYQSQVDAYGTMKTPFGDFPVLRVRTDLTRTVGFVTTTQITYSFVSECFGTVATIRSKENEDEAEFAEAAEVRRLTR